MAVDLTGLGTAVATVTLNSPARLNAFDRADLSAAQDALDRCEADTSVRCVVVRGAGRGFCAGADLDFVEAVRTGPLGEQRAALSLAPALLMRLVGFPKPTVAAVHGAAFGGGACLALACDEVILAEDARLGLVFTALGIPGGDMAATWLLSRRLGRRRAWRLLATAAIVQAGEAVAMGLVDAVVPADDLVTDACRRAEAYAAASLTALATTKRQLLRLEGLGGALEATLTREVEELLQAIRGADLAEGLAAHRMGRAPRWPGA